MLSLFVGDLCTLFTGKATKKQTNARWEVKRQFSILGGLLWQDVIVKFNVSFHFAYIYFHSLPLNSSYEISLVHDAKIR